MAVDFVHTGEIVDAVLAVLRGADGPAHTGGLPASWFGEEPGGQEVPLVLLEHGDLADYPLTDKLSSLCPSIMVRGLGPRPAPRQGTGGVQETEELIRILHLRGFDQSRDDSGRPLRNASRARERYAKIISMALFHDPHRRLATINAAGERTEPELSCMDGAGAQIVSVSWEGWDMGQEGQLATEEVAAVRALGLNLWAIACDLRVRIRSGGPA